MMNYKAVLLVFFTFLPSFYASSQVLTCSDVLSLRSGSGAISEKMAHLMNEAYRKPFSKRVETVLFKTRNEGDIREDHFSAYELDALAEFSIPLLEGLTSKGLRLLMELFRESAQQINDTHYKLPDDFAQAWDSEVEQRLYEYTENKVVALSHGFSDRALLRTLIVRSYFSSSRPSEELIHSIVAALSVEDENNYIRLFNYTGREVMVILRFLNASPDLRVSQTFKESVEMILLEDPVPVGNNTDEAFQRDYGSSHDYGEDDEGSGDGFDSIPEVDSRILDNGSF